MNISLKHPPKLDPNFVPAAIWNRSYREKVAASDDRKPLVLALSEADGDLTSVFRTEVLDDGGAFDDTVRYVERIVKFLLWQRGGCNVTVAGNSMLAEELREAYSGGGERAFDAHFLGGRLFGQEIEILDVANADSIGEPASEVVSLGRHLDGCRIGFDLGGSDRKAAAVIDGEVVFSEEIAWDPYFQSDPQYHFDGIRDSLQRAAKHLPRVDAIGGSAAGVYVHNEVRGGSLFRGVSDSDFDAKVRRIFHDVLKAEGWADVPWNVINDGDVTALAGSMSLGKNAVLGLSMGTSEAAGYVGPSGNIRNWLSELAFAPVDYREDAALDEWSDDRGCGVQYFSQQAVARLAPEAGIKLASGMPFAEQLEEVQALMEKGDSRAADIYEAIGAYLGYSLPHYAEFYEIDHLLILGRVTSGEGGETIIRKAREVMGDEFPEVGERIEIHTPDEKDKRHGQAIAAASLPPLAR